MHTRYYDEFRVGEIFVRKAANLTEVQIIDFALTWDSQLLGINKQEAVRGQFGGVIASDFLFQTLTFSLFYDLELISKSNIIGLGVNEVH